MAEIFVTRVNDVAIVDFTEKEILDLARSQAVGLKLCELVDQKPAAILIDFRPVKLITSSMIGELLNLLKKCRAASVDLKLCNLSSELMGLFKKLKLHKTFDIYPSREKAVKAFGGGKA